MQGLCLVDREDVDMEETESQDPYDEEDEDDRTPGYSPPAFVQKKRQRGFCGLLYGVHLSNVLLDKDERVVLRMAIVFQIQH
jgi:hypothetical protein